MKTLALVLAASSLMLVFDASTAHACASLGVTCGDASILEWDRPYYMPGEVATGTGGGLWPSKHSSRSMGFPEDGPYNMYLRPSQNLKKPADADPLAIPIGQLQIEERDKTGRAIFTVPQVSTGIYFVSVCNIGCDKSLGYLSSVSVRIIANIFDERAYLAGRMIDLEDLYNRGNAQASRGDWRLRKRIRQGLQAERLDRQDLFDEIVTLDADLRRLKRELAAEPPPDQRLSLISAGGASLLAALALGRRRKDEPTA